MHPTADSRTMQVPLGLEEFERIMDSAMRAPVGVATSVPYTLAVIVTSAAGVPKVVYRKALCDPIGDEKLQWKCRGHVLEALKEYTPSLNLSQVLFERMKVETNDHYFGMQLRARPMTTDIVATALLMPDIVWGHAFPQVTGPLRALFRGEEFIFVCCAYCVTDYAEELESVWELGLLESPRQDALLRCPRGLWKARSIEDARPRDRGFRDGVQAVPSEPRPRSDANV